MKKITQPSINYIKISIYIIIFFSIHLLISDITLSADLNSKTSDIKENIEHKDDEKEPYEKPFLGVYLNPKSGLKSYGKKYKNSKGIFIPVVLYQSAAEKAGVKSEDIILKYDDNSFDNLPKSKIVKTFKDYISDEKKIGDPIKLLILRKNQFYNGKKDSETIPETPYEKELLSKKIENQLPGETITLSIHKEISEITITAILGRKPHVKDTAPPLNSELLPEYENKTNSDIKKINDLINEYQLNDAYEDLMQRFSDDEWWDDGYRTKFFRYAHRDPKKFPIMAEDLTQKISKTINKESINALELNKVAVQLMDINSFDMDESLIENLALSCEKTLTHCINHLTEYYKTLKDLHEEIYSNLSDEEKDLLKKETPVILKRFVDHYYLDIGANIQEMKNHRKVSSITQKIDYSLLYKASYLIQSLSNKKFLRALGKFKKSKSSIFDESPEKLGIFGEVILIKKVENDYIVIGGPGYTKYSKPLNFIIDTGGDDLYLNNAGAATPENKVSILIDLSGDDHYTATEKWSQGSGFMGFGLTLDCKGNDHYTSKRLSQGCAIIGVGHLIDLSGNDYYHSQELNQGVAFWGFASLLDLKGNDTYNGSLFSQAVGGTYGIGILLDVDGNDQYFAGGKHKSSYETDGIFRGSSQGFGIGFRGIASGGIGILIDLSGSDKFIAGNFSQGGGYYFGMGILKNAGNESDLYIASRYGQGFSAHSAAGILIDDGGDDTYKGLHGAVQAAAWDLGVAALIDHSGNDKYHAKGTFFSQGAAAHNGFSIFIDRNGKDHYLSDSGGIAKKQSNDYHDGYSLGFFMDFGKNIDIYDKENLNDSKYIKGEYSIFLDNN